jgi:hypothetical protein
MFRKYVCPDCGKKFLSLQKSLSHDRKAHTGIRYEYVHF